jgi:hypothetical protein
MFMLGIVVGLPPEDPVDVVVVVPPHAAKTSMSSRLPSKRENIYLFIQEEASFCPLIRRDQGVIMVQQNMSNRKGAFPFASFQMLPTIAASISIVLRKENSKRTIICSHLVFSHPLLRNRPCDKEEVP